MKALVIYDSEFGNTEKVAQAIGTALGSQGDDVAVLRAGDVGPDALRGLDILVVGSPTQGFQPLPAVKKFLKSIPAQGLEGLKVAAFDTRFSMDSVDSGFLKFMVKLFGYAAEPIAKRLTQKGGDLRVPPEGFIVEDTEGPLRDGELERAAEWAQQLLPK